MPRTGWDTVTIPGCVSGWSALSQRFGKLAFGDLFEPGIEYARKGIRCNAVCPGPIGTPPLLAMDKSRPETLKAIREAIPMGRLAKPEEIAAVVAFLVSEEAGYITGANISVNGGMHMM